MKTFFGFLTMFYGLSVPIARPVSLLVAWTIALCVVPLPAIAQAEESINVNLDTEPLAAPGGGGPPLPSPEQSAQMLQLPEGFRASVFAAEPTIRNPIDLAWDGSGNLWVAENLTYAKRGVAFRTDLHDRVSILIDENHDGIMDSSRVFIDGLDKLTSVEVGRGGTWLMCPPRLLFVPDGDQNGVADGPAQTVMDGFTVAEQNYHNFANGLRFGPDGWLYGRCGGSCPGRIGAPGTPDEQRTALEGGIWRFNVDTKHFEVLCHGTTNPWGHDFNEVGELFFINTVNGHLWHGIAGAHFKRPFTLDPNPDVYELIDQHADHYHFDTGSSWTQSRDGAANDFGGGHAHSGMMIYQESTWPDSFAGDLFTLNFHGRRANREHLHRSGTGYVGKHGKDFFLSDDAWFRGMEITAGPDGNVFVADWSDLGECHEHTGVHRSSGRIMKISFGGSGNPTITAERIQSLQTNDPLNLAQLQRSPDRWFSHQARLKLFHLHGEGADLRNAIQFLEKAIQQETDVATRCRMFWTLEGIGGISTAEIIEAMPTWPEPLRVAAVRALTKSWPIDDLFGPTHASKVTASSTQNHAANFVGHWKGWLEDDSPAMRLALASSLQRLPIALRSQAARTLLSISKDADAEDHNQSKLIWYGLMSLPDENVTELIQVLEVSQLPVLNSLIARAIGERSPSQPKLLNDLLGLVVKRLDSIDVHAAWTSSVLSGLDQGLVGVSKSTPPTTFGRLQQWTHMAATSPPNSNDRVLFETNKTTFDKLATIFGDGVPAAELVQVAKEGLTVEARLAAWLGLVDLHTQHENDESINQDALLELATPLISDAKVNLRAARGLVTIDNIGVAKLLTKNLRRFRAPRRPEILSMLCSRLSFAEVLLDAVEQNKIASDALSASQARVLLSHQDKQLTKRVESLWGKIRETPDERLAEVKRLKLMLTSNPDRELNHQAGRILFDKNCASCHQLFGEGGKVGPALTGAQRSDLDYLLHNMVDPDAVVSADYRATKILTVNGQLLVGLVTERTRRSIKLVSATQTWILPTEEIEEEMMTDQSPMPAGLLQPLTDQEIADLIGYLQRPTQISLN